VAIADAVYRETLGRLGSPTLQRTVDPLSPAVRNRTGQLLDMALSTDAMNGDDWDELTVNLWAFPAVFVHPPTAWAVLAERLLLEMIISGGNGWLQRSEALFRLLGHPCGEMPVIAACATLSADRTNQIFIEPLTILEMSSHPDAANHLLRQIVDPTNDHAHRGAWWAVAEKVGRGHFTSAQLEALGDQAVALLTADAQHPACRLAAAELLRQMPATASWRVRSAVRRVASVDALTGNVLKTGRTAPAGVAAAVVAGLAADAMRLTPRDVLDHDPMLAHLLDEMLFHPQISHRLLAAQLIAASPYSVAIGAAIGDELRRPRVLASAELAVPMVNALTHFSDVDRRRLVERLVLAPGVPAPVMEAAAWSVGHGRGPGDLRFWPAAFARHLAGGDPHVHTGPAGAPPLTVSAARGLVYSLGIHHNVALLRKLRTDTSAPHHVRIAAAWWLNIPEHILSSVRRPDN